MNVITWVRQGGRRYPQVSGPSVIGIAWPSIGSPAVPSVTGTPRGLPSGWWLMLWI